MSYFLVAFSAALWGITGVFTKNITALGFTPLEMSLARTFFAVVVLGVIFLIKDRSLFRLENKGEIKKFIVMSVFGYCLYNVAYVMAVNETGVGVAGALFYTYPAFVLIQSRIIFGEKITFKRIIVIIITFVGCVCVSGLLNGNTTECSLKGIFLGIISGFSFALYSVLSKNLLKKYSSQTVTFYTFVTALVVFIIIGNALGTTLKIMDTNSIVLIIVFSIAISVMPYLCYLKGLSQIDAGRASIITTIEPIVAAMVGIVIYGEAVTGIKIIGVLLIVGAVCFMNSKVWEKNGS